MIGQDWRLVGTGTKICQTSAKDNIEKNLEKNSALFCESLNTNSTYSCINPTFNVTFRKNLSHKLASGSQKLAHRYSAILFTSVVE